MGAQIMSAHILNKTLLMEFFKSARKKKKITKAADRKLKLEEFILGKENCKFSNCKCDLLFGMISQGRL